MEAKENMEKQKKKLGLLPKLVIAIVLGIVVGFVAQNMGSAGELIIRLGATYNSIFGNFISFCIPLIIIGFVVPGIADLGEGAGKTLAITTLVAYGSTIIAGTLAFGVDSALFPHLVDAGMFITDAENAEETVVASLFTIDMPAIMGVMSALLVSFILGLGIAVTHADPLKRVMVDFGSIIEKLVGSIEGDIPEAMYMSRAEELTREYEIRLQQNGLNMKDFLKYSGQTIDQLTASFMGEAERQVKTRLALEAVVAKAGIEAAEEDVEAEYSKIAETYKMEVEAVKGLIKAEDIKKDLAVNKAIDLIKTTAKITEKAE